MWLSGGVESTTVAYMMKKELEYTDILALSISYVHMARHEEVLCIDKICDELKFAKKGGQS
jgi:7-cyano-7-deazaguanine synthase in queuosine biosynthesis